MSPVHLRNLGIQRNQPEDREGLFTNRIPERGHLGHSGGWQKTEENHTHSSIHLPIQQKPQTRGLEPEDISQGHTLQRPYGNHQRMNSQQEFQAPGGEGNQDKGKSSHYIIYGRAAEPDRAYSDSSRLTRTRPTQLSSGFMPFRHHKISHQESPLFTIPGVSQEKTRIQR
ncbi:hypothetical protein O181_012281 [Austropuccinia psidii MF-1]|uniref:Uncharacterized protein n=1 Tax=Austropuccinia psidii MF-1 TaxID=1389203 RepID=A0A9Q3BXH7_9BASI|nr:hypothetical protein [Austropuccinia psidii MF-1]